MGTNDVVLVHYGSLLVCFFLCLQLLGLFSIDKAAFYVHSL